jgi:hypothetical protein
MPTNEELIEALEVGLAWMEAIDCLRCTDELVTDYDEFCSDQDNHRRLIKKLKALP